MASPKSRFFLFGTLVACLPTSASDAYSLNIENSLAQCIAIGQHTTSDYNGMLLATFSVQKIQPISECGCKSMLGEFQVLAVAKDYQSQLMQGKLALDQAQVLTLPLAMQPKIVGNRPIKLKLFCAPPD